MSKMDKCKVISYVAAIFNPIPTGLVAGILLSREKKYKETGRNVLIISFSVILVLLFLSMLIPW